MQYCFNPVVSGQTRFLPLDYDDMDNLSAVKPYGFV